MAQTDHNGVSGRTLHGRVLCGEFTHTHTRNFLNSIYFPPLPPQVPVVGLEGDEMVDMGENFRRLQGMALSASLSSIPSMFAGNKRTMHDTFTHATCNTTQLRRFQSSVVY